VVASWDNVLGLDLIASADLPPALRALIDERDAARAAGDYARGDEIRERLKADGIDLLDSASGTRWTRR
jgi:cysteinyl-tRNA synthetase